jgi:DNA-binding transcriptional ArsR family regulator
MDANGAVKAVSALAHLHRLTVFRMLVREGLSGLPAGEIAARLEIAPSALSFHLAHLERAGLVQSWRSGRNSIYAVNVQGMRELLTFLTEDCCNGRPELCGGIATTSDTRQSRGTVANERRGNHDAATSAAAGRRRGCRTTA